MKLFKALLAILIPVVALSLFIFLDKCAAQQQVVVTVTTISYKYEHNLSTAPAMVTDGMWEVDVWEEKDGVWYWVWKNNLVKFQNDHPDLRIRMISPSVYCVNDMKGTPYRYFIWTEKKQTRAEIQYP